MHPQARLFCEIAIQLELLTREQVTQCQRKQQSEFKGRNIATITTALGLLTQSDAEVVLSHLQRVLERRREARAASHGQREREAMAERRAVVNSPTATKARREKDLPVAPPPSSQWTAAREESARPHASTKVARSESPGNPASTNHSSGGPPSRGPAGAARPQAKSGVAEQARDTLNERPNGSRSSASGSAEARPNSATEARVQRTQIGHGTPQRQPPAVPPVPSDARAASSSRSGPALGPPAASSSDATHPRGPLARRASAGGGTLLGPAALASQQAESGHAANKPRARPVPTARDWRNPSRPPPMAAGQPEVTLGQVAQADTLVLPANDAPQTRTKLPAPDTHRYLDAAMTIAQESGASDLHVHSGAPPYLRIDGKLWPMAGDNSLSRETVERVIAELLDESQWMQLMVDGDLRFTHELPGVGRFRVHAYCQERGTDVVIRVLPKHIPAPDKLGLSSVLRTLTEQSPSGLCVCTGPAGSGKTTTLAALTHALTTQRALHVVTLESPIEVVYQAGLGLIEQREIGLHVASFAAGIEIAQRQGADVIVVSDLGAPGALEASLHAARSGSLVLASMRASSSVQALGKLLQTSEPGAAECRRSELAFLLRVLTHQRLVPRARTAGRIAVFEKVVNTAQVAPLIREDRLQQLPAVMAAGKSVGMSSLDEALDELVRAGTVPADAARRSAHRRERLKTA